MRRGVAAVLVLVILLATLVTATNGAPALYPPKPGQAVAIYLLDNGTHTDLGVPRELVAAHDGPLAAATAMTTAAPWVAVGWGDRDFYVATSPWQDRIPDGLAALIGGRPTVVHIEGIGDRPDLAWGPSGVHRLLVSPGGLAALVARADRAFALRAGAPVLVPSGRPPGEAFFASRERFSAIHLCNHWTAQMLAAAGLPTTPVLDTLPAGMVLDLKLRAGLHAGVDNVGAER